MAMKFKWITPDGPEYAAERMLRWEVLLKPLGIPPEVKDAEESNSLHLAAYEGKKLVGCVCFHPESASNGRIYQMAVSEEYQGRGFGRQLLHILERTLAEKGISDVYLFCPSDLEKFYQLMGYQPQEDVVVNMGISQRKMRKSLAA